MKTNVKRSVSTIAVAPVTHEGAPASKISNELQLRRSVMACLLWEYNFYEDGTTIADRIKGLIKSVNPETVAMMAIEAREDMKLRHIPLFLVREMARLETHRHLVSDTLERVIQRADELSKFMAIYWKDGRQPLSSQVKKGLARAFTKFDEYALGKWDKDGSVKLKDVLFLSHARPVDKAQEKLWKKLAAGTIATPDTWEVALSASQGENKKAVWTRLLKEGKVPPFAFIKNLRNMEQAGVEKSLVRETFATLKTERLLPFNFVTAARYCPQYEPELGTAMLKCLEGVEKIPGKTILLVDVSGSMDSPLSGKSETNCRDAASGLAILAQEMFEDVEIFTFSNNTVFVPARHGFALRDAVVNSQGHGGTDLGGAVKYVNGKYKYERVIVITDEQANSRNSIPEPTGKGYVINVSTNKNGVGYGAWTHIDGWSEHVINYITTVEGIKLVAKKTLEPLKFHGKVKVVAKIPIQAEKAGHKNGYRANVLKKTRKTSKRK